MAWFNEDWTRRRQLDVTEQAGESRTNLEVELGLNSSNFNFDDADANGDDLRVTEADGETLTDYWIEEWDASAEEATVWIRVPSLSANANTELYLYYDNPEATPASDGVATFKFFDDFTENRADYQNGGYTLNTSEERLDYDVDRGTDDHFLYDNDVPMDEDLLYNYTFTITGWANNWGLQGFGFIDSIRAPNNFHFDYTDSVGNQTFRDSDTSTTDTRTEYNPGDSDNYGTRFGEGTGGIGSEYEITTEYQQSTHSVTLDIDGGSHVQTESDDISGVTKANLSQVGFVGPTTGETTREQQGYIHSPVIVRGLADPVPSTSVGAEEVVDPILLTTETAESVPPNSQFTADVEVTNNTGEEQTFDVTISFTGNLSTGESATKTTSSLADGASETLTWEVDTSEPGDASITWDASANTTEDQNDLTHELEIVPPARLIRRKVISRGVIGRKRVR